MLEVLGVLGDRGANRGARSLVVLQLRKSHHGRDPLRRISRAGAFDQGVAAPVTEAEQGRARLLPDPFVRIRQVLREKGNRVGVAERGEQSEELARTEGVSQVLVARRAREKPCRQVRWWALRESAQRRDGHEVVRRLRRIEQPGERERAGIAGADA